MSGWADERELRKEIGKYFVSQGLILRLDALLQLEKMWKSLSKPQVETELGKIKEAIDTIRKESGLTGNELGIELLGQALKLTDRGSQIGMTSETLIRPRQEAKSNRGPSFTKSIPEENHTNGNPGKQVVIKDRLDERMGESLIVLSNFGEIASISFRNQLREPSAQSKERGIIVPGKELIERSIEKYNRMRYLLKASGKYMYQHDPAAQGGNLPPGTTLLHEIGSMIGAKGNYSIFGLIFRNGKKLYVQDTMSNLEIAIDHTTQAADGYYHEKHFLILEGEMLANQFKVTKVSQPVLDYIPHINLGVSKGLELFGYKEKFLSLGVASANTSTIARKHLGLMDFSNPPTGIISIFSDFNLNNSNLTFLDHALLAMSIKLPHERVDLLLLCGPFAPDISGGTKEDQMLLEDKFNSLATVLLRHHKFLGDLVIGIVPDLTDPLMNLLPRKAIPEYLVEKLSTDFPRVCLMENPLHFSYAGQKCVLIRADMLKVMARKDIIIGQPRDHLDSYVNTILGQRSLVPVSGYCIPKFAGFEDSLEMYALPDIIFLCDNLTETKAVYGQKHLSIYTTGSVGRNRCYLEVNVKTKESKAVTRDKFVAAGGGASSSQHFHGLSQDHLNHNMGHTGVY
jgi:DNA polymerase alpha/epsilon subunit B